MAITSSGSVLVRLPANEPYGAGMSRFREWLDANNIEPLLFKSGALTDGSITCEIAFRTNSQAALFDREFG